MAALRIQEACGCPMQMENPHSSMLKKRPFMRDISFATVDHCKWWSPEFPHKCRKRTAIYRVGGADWEPNRPLGNHDCGFCVGRKHVQKIGSSKLREPTPERHVGSRDQT
jgi:hypothetical protein